MALHRSRQLAMVAGLTLAFAAVVSATPPASRAATAMPAHVYSPYFETWTTDSITTTAQQSGVRYFTLAFLETLSKTSCTLAWDGDSARTLAASPVPYVSDVASLRTLGGDVVPSFGGWSADQGGTEIGDSCSNVNTIAAAYEQVVTTYNVSRLDMDIEGRSLTNTAGIDRRNKAIKLVQAWATANGRPLTVSYTIPTTATGLEDTGKAILSNAVSNGVRIDVVQPMVFDYYDRVTTDMGTAAINAVTGVWNYLPTIVAGKTDAQYWSMIGATIMNGIDDYPKKTEVTTLAHTTQLFNFAKSKGMAVLSMWAIERDNGGCPGNGGANNCSGIVQNTWDFSHILTPYTG